MRRSARTDLCGGRSAMIVPTASPEELDSHGEQQTLFASGQLPAAPGNRKRAITSRFPNSSASSRNGFPFISLPRRSAGKRFKNRATHLASPSSMAVLECFLELLTPSMPLTDNLCVLTNLAIRQNPYCFKT
jgi:hypothetical protein